MGDETTEETERETDVAAYVVAGLYAIAIGVNLYIILDQMTNGASSREISLFLTRQRGRVKHWNDQRKQFRKDRAHMLFQVHETLEEQ